MQFRTKYDYKPSPGEVFEQIEGITPDKVNRAGFVPIRDRLMMMQQAGQTLQSVREQQYPADEAESIVLPLYSDKLALVDEFREATRERVERYNALREEAKKREEKEAAEFEEFKKGKTTSAPVSGDGKVSPVSPLER